MAILQLPKTFCSSLTSAVARFWWQSSGRNKGIHWRKFEDLCSPKSLGGLGFKDFQAMNSSMLSKQVWRLCQDPNAYWAATIKAIYYPKSKFKLAKMGSRPSWVWRSILHGRDLILKEARWDIGSGRMLSIKDDNWVASGRKAILLPTATATKVSDLINTSSGWDIDKLRANLSPQSAIEALKTPISSTSKEDRLVWPHSINGSYTVKSGYRLLIPTAKPNPRASTSASIPVDIWEVIWGANVPSKVKHFMWRACHYFIPTREALFKKKISSTPKCPFCVTEHETVEHLLLLCPWTQPLWFGLQFIPIPNPTGLTTIHNWVLEMFASFLDKSNHGLTKLMFTLWNIWKERNDAFYNDKRPNPTGTMHRISTLVLEYVSATTAIPVANPNSGSVSLEKIPVTWKPPPQNILKINSDATFNKVTGTGYAGVVCRDDRGSLLTASHKRIFANSALVAEALALREAVFLAVSLQIQAVIFESDNKSLVDICNQKKSSKEVNSIISDILALNMKITSCEITWTRRDGNKLAHEIASLARSRSLLSNWTTRPPDALRKVIMEDCRNLWV